MSVCSIVKKTLKYKDCLISIVGVDIVLFANEAKRNCEMVL